MESASSKLSLLYHNIFDYPLTSTELFVWSTGLKSQMLNAKCQIKNKDNFYFINGRQNIVKIRLQNEKYSRKKMIIAKKAAELISKIPSVLFVGITGSLAMMNADKNSDIDLMVITRHNTLWTTRLLVYGLLRVTGYELRKPKQDNEKDMLCINLWLNENDLVWDKKDRNIYTAHEIAQIVPLINKECIYEKFLYLNKWILDYWPNSVHIERIAKREQVIGKTLFAIRYTLYAFEFVARQIQFMYMKRKISREIVTPTRAIFHPTDFGKKVITKLSS